MALISLTLKVASYVSNVSIAHILQKKNKSIKSIILTKLRDQKAGYTKCHVGAEELLKVTGSHVSLYIKRGKVAPYVTYVRNVGRGRLSSE